MQVVKFLAVIRRRTESFVVAFVLDRPQPSCRIESCCLYTSRGGLVFQARRANTSLAGGVNHRTELIRVSRPGGSTHSPLPFYVGPSGLFVSKRLSPKSGWACADCACFFGIGEGNARRELCRSRINSPQITRLFAACASPIYTGGTDFRPFQTLVLCLSLILGLSPSIVTRRVSEGEAGIRCIPRLRVGLLFLKLTLIFSWYAALVVC